MDNVIGSLLDTDLYKLTMHQVVLHKFPGAYAKYRFKCRNDVNLLAFKEEIEDEFDHLCTLRMTDDERDYLRTIPFLTDDYINFLEDYRPKRRFIHVDEKDGDLDIWFEGPILQTMPFEIWALKIVNEVYFRNTQPNPDYIKGVKHLDNKILMIKDYLGIDDNFASDFELDEFTTRTFKFADFGSRRAFSGNWQMTVVNKLQKSLPKDVFVGTSNIEIAMGLGIKPIGTFAHEFIQMFQGLGVCTLADSQKVALQTWSDEYRGELGICLSDTLGLDKFLNDFDAYFGKLFDGVRHDSGDPYDFADRMVEHYKSLGIDPRTKTIVFSDGLDIPLAIKIAEHCKYRIQVSFGIGTNLTNDLGYTPLPIVIKMVECGIDANSMSPVAKISDNPAKTMCEDQGFIDYLRQVIV